MQKAPPPTLSAIPDPSCARRLTGPSDAATLAARGVPLGLALQQTGIVSVPELEKLIDDYAAFTASRPELKALHDDAVRRGPEIFARRLDQEEAESRVAEAHQRMADTAQHLVVRPPLVIAQRAAVGEVAIPVAKVVDTLVKLTPIAGELLATLEVVTGKTLGGLGFDLSASERALTAVLIAVPYAASALKAGVRGAAELARMARGSGRSIEETRALCTALVTLEKNKAALAEGIAAAKAGRPLTTAQRAAVEEATSALQTIRGAASRSRLDPAGQKLMSNAEKAAIPTFAPNPGGAQRSVDEALAIASKHGVEVPDFVKVVLDPKVPIGERYADYEVVKDVTRGVGFSWKNVRVPIEVHVHPSVLQSDEAIVGVLQHETYELERLSCTLQERTLTSDQLSTMVDGRGVSNIHGQAWDVADLRVFIMRESDPVRKAALQDRMKTMLAKFDRMVDQH